MKKTIYLLSLLLLTSFFLISYMSVNYLSKENDNNQPHQVMGNQIIALQGLNSVTPVLLIKKD